MSVRHTITLDENQKIYFTSDTHYGHKNICRGVSSWDLDNHGGNTSVRDFDTLDEMNQEIVDGINRVVREEDLLVHLGDWSFGGVANILKFRRKLNCNNIILILGNHDQHIDKNKKILIDTPLSKIEEGGSVPAKDLFMEIFSSVILEVKFGDYGTETYFLSHYPTVVYDKAHHGSLHLYGHVHGSYTHPGRALDVGIDNRFKLKNKYEPWSQMDIGRYMRGRDYVQLSHHNKNTN